MDTDYITTEEAARELGVTPQRVRALIKAGRLKAKSVGVGNRATYLIRPADLDAVRDRKPGRPPKDPAAEPASKKPSKPAKGKPGRSHARGKP